MFSNNRRLTWKSSCYFKKETDLGKEFGNKPIVYRGGFRATYDSFHIWKCRESHLLLLNLNTLPAPRLTF